MSEVIKIGHADPDAWKQDREPLFSIEDKSGEVREYTIPREVPGSFTLRAMEVYRSGGDGAATPFILEEMLGEDGYAALLAAPGLTKTNLAAVTKVIRDKVLGDPEDAASEPGKR